MNRRTPRRMNTRNAPKIRGGGTITPIVNRHNSRFNSSVKRPQSQEAFYCNNRNMEQCRNFLLQATNNSQTVHKMFDILNTNAKFNAVRSNQTNIEQIAQEGGYNTDGIFCGGSECGDFYGIGSCNGTCCGVGGLGIGCNFKLKNENREY